MGGPWRRGGGRGGEAKQVRREEKNEMAAVVVSSRRLKREDCRRTKHDSAFSRWEILIGSSDWENYSLGKDGAERYRIHNLPPSCSCPGLYELGVASIPDNTRKFDPTNIVVVYLGQAENIRSRLQQYGRTGSHLEHGESIVLSKNGCSNASQRGPGLFKEMFSKGISIMFRWASMRSKLEAMDIEARLLEIFDYAWNRIGNDVCRHDDILLKLDKLIRANPFHSFLRKLHLWKQKALGKKKDGIQILSSEPFKKDVALDDPKCNYTSMVYKFNKSQQILVQPRDFQCRHDMCGVTKDDGSICRKKPVSRRKRCEEHRGKRINRNIPLSGKESTIKGAPVHCGVVLEDGSICQAAPSSGRKRCSLHKGRRVCDSKFAMSPKSL